MQAKPNKEKSKQLGMPLGTASAKLRKALLFHLARKCAMDKCYRCSETIVRIEDFTVEHKEPWLHSESPLAKFFDLENIAFSHHDCNMKHRRIPIFKLGAAQFRGVSFKADKGRQNKWRAVINFNGEHIALGQYPTPEDAAKAYDQAAVNYHGGRAVTNVSLGLLPS